MSTETQVVEPSAATAVEPTPTQASAPVAGPPPEVAAAAEAARQAATTPTPVEPTAEPTGLLALIGEDTRTGQFLKELRWNNAYYRLALGF